jgi:exodeoxyribonuclease VII large subunit
VGIVTSKSGDAVDDIEKTAKKRNPYVELILYPVTVQGKDSAMEFARGIKTLDKMGVDTIIIGRGGGSKEDLDAFNDERLIRAVYDAETPVISATGHSKNWTLADYVADLRVITPTEAAIEAIPDLMKELRRIDDYKETMDRQIKYRLQMAKSRINELEGKLRISGPEETLKRQMLTLRQLSERIHPAIQRKYTKVLEREEQLRTLLAPGVERKVSKAVEKENQLRALIHPAMQRKVERTRERQSSLEDKLYPAMERKLDVTKRNAIALTNQLHALAPTAKLQGGFGYIELKSKEAKSGAEEYTPLRSIADVKSGDKVRVTLHDGKLSATVDHAETDEA